MSDIGTGVFVFYSNHTYRHETTTGNSKVKTILGTWTLTGDQLEMTLLAEQEDRKDNPKKGTLPEKTTVSFNGKNIMEWTTKYPDDPNILKNRANLFEQHHIPDVSLLSPRVKYL
ncbi:MAG: hypothetical protein WDM78_05015 [Puia sp.]